MLDELMNVPCHAAYPNDIKSWLGGYRVGSLAFDPSDIVDEAGGSFSNIVIRDRVYNVTNYVNGIRNEFGAIEKDPEKSDNAYLTGLLHFLITHKLNEVRFLALEVSNYDLLSSP